MKGSIFTILTLLGAFSASNASPFKSSAKTRAFVPDTKSMSTIPRGGAGPIESLNAAKIAGTISLLQGAYCALAPKGNAEAYGVEDMSPCTTKVMRRSGILLLNTGITIFCQVFKDYSLKTSAAINGLIWVAETLHSLWNNKSETTGPSKAGDISILALNAVTVYAALNNLDWFMTSLKAFSTYWIIAGLPCLFAPKFAMKLWELKGDDESTPGIVTIVGCNMEISSVLTAALAWGVEPITALGYAAAAAVVCHTKANLFSPEIDVLNVDRKIRAFWPIYYAAIAASILL